MRIGKQAQYFFFDDGNWLETVGNNTRIRIGGMKKPPDNEKFHGSVSCVQIYNAAMNEAELITKMNCPDLPVSTKSSPCPEGYNPYKEKCIKVFSLIRNSLKSTKG